jgi:hemoglobin
MTLHHSLALTALACLLCAVLAPQPAHAQAAAAAPIVTGPAEAALLQELGGVAGIRAFVGDFVDRMHSDARVGAFFQDVKPAYLKKQISDQFCEMLGGGCVYDGESMQKSHAGLQIARKDFLACVELLQDAMDARGIPFSAQKRLLARLAPTHRDIITR